MVTLSVNGKEIEGEGDENLLEMLIKQGFEIPHLCSCKGIVSGGRCGLCLICAPLKEKNVRACEFTVSEYADEYGYEILTYSDEIDASRTSILQAIVRTHPAECASCDKWGECKLADLIAQYLSEKHEDYTKICSQFEDWGKNIRFSAERCIKCGLCIAFEKQVFGTDKIALIGWGDMLRPFVSVQNPLEEHLSLNLTEICPVGAIEARTPVYPAPSWHMHRKSGKCLSCQSYCDVDFLMHNDEIIDFRRNSDDAWNLICDDARLELLEMRENKLGKVFMGFRELNVESAWLSEFEELFTSLADKNCGIITTAGLFNKEFESVNDFIENAGLNVRMELGAQAFSKDIFTKTGLFRNKLKGINPCAPSRYGFEDIDVSKIPLSKFKENEIEVLIICNCDVIYHQGLEKLLAQLTEELPELDILAFTSFKFKTSNRIIQIPVAGRFERSGSVYTPKIIKLNKVVDVNYTKLHEYEVESRQIDSSINPCEGVQRLEDILETLKSVYLAG